MKNTATETWEEILVEVMNSGKECSPRGSKVKEITGYQSTIDMRQPVVSLAKRKLSRKFMAAEAIWILTGDNRTSTIVPHNSAMGKFSDDGTYFNGAYGPRVVDQLTYVVDSLVLDKDSRQSVMTIWRENPRPSRDIPCTVAVQWLIRKKFDRQGIERDALHCVDTMRSSDAWLGWPYDVVNFTMLTVTVALMYQQRTGSSLDLGTLTMQCGSQHLYEKNWAAVDEILTDPGQMIEYADLDLSDFDTPRDLLNRLEAIRDGSASNPSRSKFMEEFL